MVPGAATATLNIDDETLNSTQTEMYFGQVDATLGVKQLWWMSRASITDNWGTPALMDSTFNVVTTTPTQEESPRLSPDDKTLYFGRGGNIYYAQRSSPGAAWGTPVPLASVNTGPYVKWFAICDNDYFMISRLNGTTQGQDLYEGQLGTGPGVVATELNSTSNEISTFLSKDCNTTYFASNRSGTPQIYVATRANPTATWTAPQLVTDFGMSADNEDPWLSQDGLTFYFATERFGGTNTNKGVYCSTR
jgi:Tol biopolymer transport system component